MFDMSGQQHRAAQGGTVNVRPPSFDEAIGTWDGVKRRPILKVRPRKSALPGWTAPVVAAFAFAALSVGVLSVPDAPEVLSRSATLSSKCVVHAGILSVPDAPEATCSAPTVVPSS